MDIFKTQCLEYNRGILRNTFEKKIGGNSNGNNTSESHVPRSNLARIFGNPIISENEGAKQRSGD